MNTALGILALLRRPKPRPTLTIAEDWTCSLAAIYSSIYEAERAVDAACVAFGSEQRAEAERRLADAARWIEHARRVNREAARR